MTEERCAVVDETAGDDLRRGFAIRVVPNCSLTPRQALGFFMSLFVVSFAIAGYFAAHGLWPVLPFAGIEMAVLGWALVSSLKRRGYEQTITVTASEVGVVTRDERGVRTVAFARHWARVRLIRGGGWHASRLVIESHGRACELARLLTDDERRRLHARLLPIVGVMNESPPVADMATA